MAAQQAADPEGVGHASISRSELEHRSLASVILDVPYVTHIFDVYTGHRVDKRTLVSSGYVRAQAVMDHPPMR